jgi:hypothetical protein
VVCVHVYPSSLVSDAGRLVTIYILFLSVERFLRLLISQSSRYSRPLQFRRFRSLIAFAFFSFSFSWGIAETLKMGSSSQASHQISALTSPPASDITVDPTVQWKLVQERANQTLAELLLLLFFVVLTSARFLRRVIGDTSFLSPSHEEISSPAPLTPSSSSPKLPSSPAAVRPPRVLSINPVSLVSPPLQSPSPSPPPSPPLQASDIVSLTIEELLEAMGLPKDVSSLKVLAKLGVLPNESLAELDLLLDDTLLPSPSSPLVSSPPAYVPPQRRASPAPAPAPAPSVTPAPPGPPYVSIVKVGKGCVYCHNKEPYSLGLAHTHRNHCPWFHHHLAMGTCHLNNVGELCLGPRRAGAWPLPFWSSSISQGEQVKRRTDGTEWDERPERRPSNPVVFGSGVVSLERRKL